MPLFYIPKPEPRRLGELPCTPAKPVGIKSKRLHPVWILNSHSLLHADAGVIGYGDGIVTGIQKAVRTETSFFKIFYIIKAVVLSPGIPAARIIPFPVIPVFVIPKAIITVVVVFCAIFMEPLFIEALTIVFRKPEVLCKQGRSQGDESKAPELCTAPS